MYDILIVGGGASGFMTAITAAKINQNLKIAILERNNAPCKKLYATGNGHCNFLNERAEDYELIRDELLAIGIVGVIDEDGRVYPRSREASSVAAVLVGAAKKFGVEIICDCHITDMKKSDETFILQSKDGRRFESKKLVISCGGKAGIQFGCYGEGYRWAQQFGHRLRKPIPALVGLKCAEDINMLAGIRVRAAVSLLCNGELISSDSGEVQFGKDSISGICVMNLSRNLRIEEDKVYELSVDLYPEYSREKLLELFMKQKELSGCAMNCLVPEKVHAYLHNRIEISCHNPANMADLSKNLKFTIIGSNGWDSAQVTSGGILLSEINEQSYESKLVDNLYFTGEIIDYDGPCGGFNLAHAWKSGIFAGRDLSK